MNLRTFLGYGHGMAWKLSALASKLGFVLLVLPRLPDGVFAQYAYVSSVVLLGALIFSFGAMDALPISIRGRKSVSRMLAPMFQTTLVATCLVFLGYVTGGGLWVLAGAAAGCSLSYFILSGIVRTISPSQFEILTNAPSIAFLIMALALPVDTVHDLLVMFVVANFVVLLAIGWTSSMFILPNRRASSFSVATARNLLKRGNAKSLSNILMVADFRALITAPNLLLKITPSDALAVALTIGEAFWQLAMVVVNRNYARYCKGEGALNSSIATGLLLLALMTAGGLFLVYVPLPVRIARFDQVLIGWGIVFFAAATALTEMRAYYWSRNMHDVWILLAQIVIVIMQIIVIMSFPMSRWLMASAIILCLGTLLLSGGLYMAGKTRPSSRQTGAAAPRPPD